MNFSSPYIALPSRLSVAENLRVYGHLYSVRELERADRRARRRAGPARLPATVRPGSLRAGQKTRVALAKALINRPDVLLLDEPTASLDPDTGDMVRSWLERYRAESGCTILLAVAQHGRGGAAVRHGADAEAGPRSSIGGAPADLLARYGRDDLEQVFLDIARNRQGGART